ncbi:MAG: DUF1232 domain-containing protein [Erysipelotrichaceae bacterium]|nr:DUF1232 domain-containing protein [Erysipelotrichaceae bacterium]
MDKFKEKVKEIKKNVPAVFLSLKHPDTPLIAKVSAAITIGYALSPIDLIPDFIPVLGYLDDLIILPLLITITLKLIPKDIYEECRIQSENIWADGKPKKWYYAIPIILIWIIFIIYIIKIFI